MPNPIWTKKVWKTNFKNIKEEDDQFPQIAEMEILRLFLASSIDILACLRFVQNRWWNVHYFRNQIVIGEETWVHHYNPDSKQGCMQYYEKDAATPKSPKDSAYASFRILGLSINITRKSRHFIIRKIKRYRDGVELTSFRTRMHLSYITKPPSFL